MLSRCSCRCILLLYTILIHITRSILDGYFNPLVFDINEIIYSPAKNLIFCRVSKIGTDYHFLVLTKTIRGVQAVSSSNRREAQGVISPKFLLDLLRVIVTHMLHGAGIFTYMTGWFWTRANVGVDILAPWFAYGLLRGLDKNGVYEARTQRDDFHRQLRRGLLTSMSQLLLGGESQPNN